MAEVKLIEIKANTKQAQKSFEELGDIIEEQKDITIEFEKELLSLENTLNNTSKANLPKQKALKDQMNNLKGAIKEQKLAVKDLTNQRSKSTKQTELSTDAVARNYGAIQLLDSVTGGLASQFRAAQDAAKLFSFSLKGVSKALIATGVGALVVALGLIIAYWDDIVDAISGANDELEIQKQLTIDINEELERRQFINKLNLKQQKQQEEQDILKAKIAGATEAEITAIKRQGYLDRIAIADLEAKEASKVAANATDETIEAAVKAEEEAFEQLGIARGALSIFDLEQQIPIKGKGKKKSKNGETEAEKRERLYQEALRKNRLKEEKERLDFLQKKEEAENDFFDRSLSKEEQEKQAVTDKYFNLIEQAKIYGEDTLILEDAQRAALQEITDKYDEEEIAAAKKKADEQIKIERFLGDVKKEIQENNFDIAEKGLSILGNLFEGNKSIQKGLLIADSAVGIAKTIISTQASNAAITAEGAALAIPSAGASVAAAAALVASNNVSSAFSIAATVAATAKGLSALGGGGGGAGGNVGGGRTPSAPSFNVVGNSGVSQIAQTINQDQQPVEAYVVAGNVSSAQELNRNIVETASIG